MDEEQMKGFFAELVLSEIRLLRSAHNDSR